MARTPVSFTTAGLDLSLTGTGICRKRGILTDFWTIKTKPKDFECDLARLRHIADKVLTALPPPGTCLVVVEDFFTPSNPYQIKAAIGLAGLGTIVRMAMYEAGYPFYVVAQNQIKKFCTGTGRVQKSMMLREVYRKWGIEAKDDNQADAVAMAMMAEVIHKLRHGTDVSDVLKYEVEMATKVMRTRPHYN